MTEETLKALVQNLEELNCNFYNIWMALDQSRGNIRSSLERIADALEELNDAQ